MKYMKKIQLLILTLFIGFSALGQQTYFTTAPSGTTSLTGLQYRYKAITPDSLNQLFMFWNGKYNQVYTATEANLRFAPIAGGGYVPSSRLVLTNAGTFLFGGGNLGSNLSLYNDTAGLTTKNFFNDRIGTRTQDSITKKLNRSDTIGNSGYVTRLRLNTTIPTATAAALALKAPITLVNTKADSSNLYRNVLPTYAKKNFVIVDSLVNDYFNRPATGFPLTGSNISQSIVTGGWRIANSTGNITYDNYASLNYITWLPEWGYTLPVVSVANGGGIGIGLTKATNSGYAVKLDMNSAGNRGTLTLVQLKTGVDSVLAVSATNAISYTNGDQLYIALKRDGYRLVASAWKAGQTPISLIYDASLSNAKLALSVDNNTLRTYSFGGTQLINHVSFYSPLTVHRALGIIGDSNMYGYNSGVDNLYYQTAQQIITNNLTEGGFVYAASGATSADFLTTIQEFIKTQPRFALIHLGTNDARNAVSSASYQTTMNTILSKLDSAGIRPIICTVIPTTTTGWNTLIGQYNTYLNTLSNRYTIIDTYTALSSGGILAAVNTTDGLHLSAGGHGIFAATVQNAIRFLPTSTALRLTKSWAGTSSIYGEPNFIVENTSTTQGTGSSTHNRANIRVTANNGGIGGIWSSNYDSGGYTPSVTFGSTTDHPVIFLRQNAEAFRIAQTTGNILIGTAIDPGYHLTVGGNYSGSPSNASEPMVTIKNESTTMANGTSAQNRAGLRLQSGNNTVGAMILSSYASGGFGASLAIGTTTNHPILFYKNNTAVGGYNATYNLYSNFLPVGTGGTDSLVAHKNSDGTYRTIAPDYYLSTIIGASTYAKLVGGNALDGVQTITGDSQTQDGMGMLSITRLNSGVKKAFLGFTNKGTGAIAMGISPTNDWIMGTGPLRGSAATIDSVILSVNGNTGALALKNSAGTTLLSVNPLGYMKSVLPAYASGTFFPTVYNSTNDRYENGSTLIPALSAANNFTQSQTFSGSVLNLTGAGGIMALRWFDGVNQINLQPSSYTGTINHYLPSTSGTLSTQQTSTQITSGIVAPSSTPTKIGDMFIDTVLKKVYVSTGTTSSADWTLLN